MLDRLERYFGRFAVPHLALLLLVGECLTLLYHFTRTNLLATIALDAEKVLHGEVWRLFTFILMPPDTSLLFAGFALMLFYIYATALEEAWGEFRFTVYVLMGAAMTILVSFALPGQPFGVGILHTSIFLAFAYLNPEFEIALMFILPVKVKYLAMLTWAGLGFMLLFMPPGYKAMALGTAASFLVFFWRDVLATVRANRRRTTYQRQRTRGANLALHVCCVCSATEESHPHEEFRVCSQCTGGREYCSRHLKQHNHV